MLTERTALRNVLVLFDFILLVGGTHRGAVLGCQTGAALAQLHAGGGLPLASGAQCHRRVSLLLSFGYLPSSPLLFSGDPAQVGDHI